MIDKIPLFEELSLDQKSLISKGVRIQNYPSSVVIINKGDLSDNLFVLLSGRLKVFIIGNNGREVLLDFLEPNATFGELSFFDGQPRSSSVMTTEASQLAHLPKQYFLDCLKQYPEIALPLLKTLAERTRNLVERVEDLALLDVYGRVANVLITRSNKAEKEGQPTLAMTHQELANQVGASREMITRILNDLKKGGYISVKNHLITIQNRLPIHW